MSLKNELAKAAKLSSGISAQVARLSDNTDESKPLFNVIVNLDSSTPLEAEGISLNAIAGPIFTGHNMSLKNLKTLVDSPRVTIVSGGSPLRPL